MSNDNKVVNLFPKDKSSHSDDSHDNDYKKWLNTVDVLSSLLVGDLLNYRGMVRSYLEESSNGNLTPYYNQVITSSYNHEFNVVMMTILLNSGVQEIVVVPIKQIIIMKLFGYKVQGAHRRNGILYPIIDDFPDLDWKSLERKAALK